MTNHPHDCPVCEEGGNCHLQDMTVMTGHSFRRYRFTKRTHRNQDLGPFISHEMNRCIACYRCVRYYKDYADGTDLGVYGAHDNVYFGRPEDGVLESEFSGNLVEVCPTGVFTDKTHSERYNRKWDMQFAPSICQQCSIGCNISPGERYGELRRIENRYNGTVNHYFLCDRGRFGYGYVNLKDRPRQPVQRRGDDFITLNAEQAMQGAADILRQSKKVIGIGSPRASVESNFALRELVDGIEPELQSKIDVIVQALAGAKKPLIISGTNAGSAEVIQAAANVAKALKGRGADVGITMIARSVNSMGLGIMGGGSLEEALTELETGRADAVVVLENDLHRHASATRVNAALAKAPLVMVVDHQRTAIMENAHLVLSAASFAESDGTVINNEGRAQRFFQVYDPAYYDSKTVMLESWRWLHSLHSTLLSREVDWTQLDHVIDAVVAKIPELAGIKDAAPDATFRIRGQKLAREPHRYSGRTAMRANISVHEPRQPQDIDTMFTFSMEGNNQPTAHRSQVPFAWAPGWNSPQAWNKFQDEVGGKLRFGDPGVRLFETSENGLDYFTSVPARFQPQDGKWRIAPYYHLFGSDELSQRAPVFQSRMPQPYIKLNPADAAKLGVNAGTRVSFSYDGNTVTLPVEIAEGLTAGQVGLPMGMSGIAPVLAGAHLEDLKEAQQ